eukprot:gene21278-27570_t
MKDINRLFYGDLPTLVTSYLLILALILMKLVHQFQKVGKLINNGISYQMNSMLMDGNMLAISHLLDGFHKKRQVYLLEEENGVEK